MGGTGGGLLSIWTSRGSRGPRVAARIVVAVCCSFERADTTVVAGHDKSPRFVNRHDAVALSVNICIKGEGDD